MSQCQRLIRHLKDGNSINMTNAAMINSIGRLPARIHDIKNKPEYRSQIQGYVFEDKIVTHKNQFQEKYRVKEYWLRKLDDS